MRKYKFKVVKRRSNRSCMIHGHSNFSLLYEKDTAVYASPGTLGIMVFKTRWQAEDWMTSKNTYGDDLIIKRVIPIGRGKVPKVISADVEPDNIRSFYELLEEIEPKPPAYNSVRDYELDNGNEVTIVKPISGTICYPGVFVID